MVAATAQYNHCAQYWLLITQAEAVSTHFGPAADL
jgi:hypothetical protein